MKRFLKILVQISPLFLLGASAFASDGEAAPNNNFAGYAIAAAIAIALPALGGALAQGKAAAAALEGIARNPGASGKIFVPMILGMALIESLVLFGLIMAFILSGKIG
jgi:F-type H+-transporting ATPase subunit c